MFAFKLNNVTLGYDGHPAVHHLDGEIKEGSLTAIVGANGSGKSTLLKGLAGALHPLGGTIERHDFEADFGGGALVIEFEAPPAKFVVSPNAPVSQVWVSAQMKSFKLDWDPLRSAFALPDSGQTLVALLAGAIGQQLGEDVSL